MYKRIMGFFGGATMNESTGDRNSEITTEKVKEEPIQVEKFASENSEKLEENHVLLDRIEALEKDLKLRIEECETYKATLQDAEKELSKLKIHAEPKKGKVSTGVGDENVNNQDSNEIKLQDSDSFEKLTNENSELRVALTKASELLNDKTDLCANQERHNLALTNQVASLKEVVTITKDLLNIRNMEVLHLQSDVNSMESKITEERKRHNTMIEKMDEAVKLNLSLKNEYELQLKIFQDLKNKYEEKVTLLTKENKKLEKEVLMSKNETANLDHKTSDESTSTSTQNEQVLKQVINEQLHELNVTIPHEENSSVNILSDNENHILTAVTNEQMFEDSSCAINTIQNSMTDVTLPDDQKITKKDAVNLSIHNLQLEEDADVLHDEEVTESDSIVTKLKDE